MRCVRVALAVVALGSLHAAADETFEVRLSPAPRDAAMRAVIAGAGSASVSLRGSELNVVGTFAGFASPASRAELRQGAAVAMRGPVLHTLTLTPDARGTSGSFAGDLTLDAAGLAALNAGRIYVQVASDSAPDGSVWGWLLPAGTTLIRDR